jgi:hypothetical protein
MGKGISFSMTGVEVPLNIDEWPAFDGLKVNARKTPTHIAYLPGEMSYLWGYQVESHEKLCAWMKYHLDQDSPVTQYDDPELTKAMKSGLFSIQGSKSPEQVTTDYLKEVFKFTVTKLETEFGAGILKVTSIKWWLAKPAIWSYQAEKKLEQIVANAAKEANLGGARERDEFNFITEPEAAAFSLLGEAHEFKDLFQVRDPTPHSCISLLSIRRKVTQFSSATAEVALW